MPTKKLKTPDVSNGVKAVLFDIDGVLLNSFEAGLHFVGDILVAMGYRRPSRKELKKSFHLPLGPALQALAKSELTEELERLHEIVTKVDYRYDLLKVFPFTNEMLDTLFARYKLGVITSRNKGGLKRYFNFSKNKQLFSISVTVEDVSHPKPHP